MYTLRPATPADAPQINDLRGLAYAGTGSFQVTDFAALATLADPEDSIVLGMWTDDGVLAGCVRLTCCMSYGEAHTVLEVHPPVPDDQFPTVAMCRAATNPSFRGRGILPLICTAAVEWAQAMGAHSVSAVMVDGAPHKRVMADLGWSMLAIAENSMSLLQPNAGFLFLHLPASRFEQAVATGRAQRADTWRQVHPVQPWPRLRS